jgi:hypothetical protein
MSDNIEIRMESEDDERRERTPIAFILDAPTKYGFTVCYARMGQHGEAQDNYMYGLEYPKSPQDILKAHALVQELKSIGYDIGE